MMKIAVSILFLFVGFLSHAQTTFILVRHAEKDLTQSTPDPDLSAEGKQHADRLSLFLRDANVTAVYSTNYKRTKDTVKPFATLKGIEIKTYEPLKKEAIDKMIAENSGGTILISGHSNTIPWTANYLLGKEEFRLFADDEYDNVLILTINADKTEAKALRLHF